MAESTAVAERGNASAFACVRGLMAVGGRRKSRSIKMTSLPVGPGKGSAVTRIWEMMMVMVVGHWWSLFRMGVEFWRRVLLS